ncbi:ead/Ea22-like family protein [Salmonella enterica]
MTALNKQALREAAEKATPGDWRRASTRFNGITATPFSLGGEEVMLAGTSEKRDAEFIAAANPKTVLALLDELEATEKRIAEQQSAIIAPGIMRCAGCGFVLTKNSINMAAGTITAGDSKTEPCPNGCGPLWPVTWKEQAIQMRDDSEQWFLELQQAKNRIAQLEARDEPKFVKCWSCKHDIEVLAIVDCDGYCPRCAAPIDLDDEPYAGIGVKGE